jgi:lipoate-protein ligase A
LLPKGFALGEANDLFPVVLPFTEILKRPLDLVLLPYCAKDGECGHRHGKDCLSCGRCSTGKVYDEARKRGLHATTIVSFEDLRQTLSEASARGVRAFVGSCCEAFYNKHREDFERLGVPGILVDIDSITCYDLGKSGQAYRGEFDTVTSLRADLIIKTMDSFTPA